MTKRNYGLDVLKILACFGVVILHVTAEGFELSQPFNVSSYLYYLGTFSIPLFFMVNGYFLLNKPVLNYQYVFKKIRSIMVIVSFWTLVYWLLSARFDDNPVKKILGAFLQRGYFYQFWFFGSLIIIYLLLPFCHRLLKSYKIHLYLTLILLGMGLLIQALNYMPIIALKPPVQAYLPQTFRLWSWLGYYTLGGLLGRRQFLKSYGRLSRYCPPPPLILVGLLLLPFLLFNICQDVFHLKYAEYFYDSLVIKLLVIPIFIYLMRLELPQKWLKLVKSLSSASIGIFIFHVNVLRLIAGFIPLQQPMINLLALILVFFSSYFMTLVLLKVPLIRRVLTF